MNAGALISLEGIDGSGKTSLLPRVADWWRARGHTVVVVREPGSTPLGEALRQLLLTDARTGDLEPESEALLMIAARVELVRKVIRPALVQGCVVVCDRFRDSTLAYQAFGMGVSRAWVEAMEAGALGSLKPDLTLLFDLPVETAGRRGGRDDRITRRGDEFARRVRAGYLALAAEEPERIRVVDASRDPEAVWADVEAILAAFRAARWPDAEPGTGPAGGGGRP